MACIGLHRGRFGAGLRAGDSEPVRISAAEAAIRFHFPETIAVSRSGHIALLIPAGSADFGEVRAVILRALRAESTVGLAGGIGRACLGITDYANSYQEASADLQTARQRAEPCELLAPADIGFLGLLAHASGPESLENVVENALGPLLSSDAASGSEYIKTLDAYLACDRHLERTASALHVHPNTVRYRITKVQEKPGVDLHAVEVRFLLELALRVRAATATREPAHLC
jgi:sugar diacid utilization regulator